MVHDRESENEVISWAVRTSDPDFGDWAAFTEWLEASPGNATAYDAVMEAVASGEVVLRESNARRACEQPAPIRRRWLAPALAACLALVAAVWVLGQGSRGELIATAPGETRELRLADGTAVSLAGATRLRLEGARSRLATLEAGRAVFAVAHDERRPFRVKVQNAILEDVGTVFEVAIRSTGVRVAVTEGAVLFDPGGREVFVGEGRMLTFSGDGRPSVVDLPLGLVGEWREGRLSFVDASLADVVRDLASETGVAFRAGPAAGERRVSGSIDLEGVRRDPRLLGSILGVEVRREQQHWVVAP